MFINNICSPAIIYLGFSITQILIDIYKGMYNTAFLKFILSIVFSIILNILCDRGLNIISWIIVFIPFIFMTVITSILLYMFGLDPFFGKLKYNIQDFTSEPDVYVNPRDLSVTASNINQNDILDNNNSNIIQKENSNIQNLPINRVLNNNKLAENNINLPQNTDIPEDDINSDNTNEQLLDQNIQDLPVNRILTNNKLAENNINLSQNINVPENDTNIQDLPVNRILISNRNSNAYLNQNTDNSSLIDTNSQPPNNEDCNNYCFNKCKNENNNIIFCSSVCENLCNYSITNGI